jgi:DNA-binding MarR family transcriptional regulator
VSESKDIVAKKLMDAFSRFHRLNLNRSPIEEVRFSELSVLYCLKHKVPADSEGIKVSEISSFLNVTSPTVTQLINSLEKNELVERSIDKKDRRAVQIRLTPKGEKTIQEAINVFIESFHGLVDFLGEKESLQLAELLTQVYNYYNQIAV